jgi:glycosyltransferase involved in cell wall biosynthesis
MQVMKMADALTALGHEVRVFAIDGGEQVTWDELSKHYGLRGSFKVTLVKAHSIFRRYDYAIAAVRESKSWNADFVYTRVPQAATWAARRGMPTIFELHDMPSGRMGPRLLRQFLVSPGARRVVVNTQYLADQVRRAYLGAEEKLVLAPNGVDLERYTDLPDAITARRKLGLREGFTVGYTGHLYEGRGIPFMLQIANQLKDMRFLCVGGRPQDVAGREQQARGLDNVNFSGFVSNRELPLFQAACDVFVIPYNHQVASSSGGDIGAFTNPLKMFEYLATGRPILASDLPILREVLNERNAIMLPVGEAEAWLAALRDLQADPQKAAELARNGRATAEGFTWEKRAQRVLRGLDSSAKI